MKQIKHTRLKMKGLGCAMILIAAMGGFAFGHQAKAQKHTTQKTAEKKAPEKPASTIPASWKCHFCKFDYGFKGSATLGPSYVSQSSYKYGEYNGFERSGGYLDASFKLHYLNKKGDYFYARALRLGLDSRSILLQGGRQGSYELTAQYQEVPQYVFEGALTPYTNPGASNLTLPSNWVQGGSTQTMPKLSSSLHPYDISHKRTIERVGIRLLPHKSHWRYSVNFRHDTQNGIQTEGVNFLTTSTLVADPVDYTTDQVNASVNYAVQTWQFKMAYYGSFFHDRNKSLTWENPFTPYVPGANVGQIGQPPDNNFNELSVAGAWQLPASTRIMTMLAYGRELQNAQFLPVTINPTLQTDPLPRSSLEGEVITRNYVVRLDSNPLPRLNLLGSYTYGSHDDTTPQELFPQVLSDAYVAASLMNIPYSFENRKTRVAADYRVNRRVRFEVGGENADEEQVFGNTSNTRTNSEWVSSHIKPVSNLTLYLKVLQSHRIAPDYAPLADLFAPENPLLRQYNIGTRLRKQGQATLTYSPTDYLDLSVQWQQNRDNYSDTTIGLTNSKDTNYTLDIGLQPTKDISVSGYYTNEKYTNNQAGSQNFSSPDWYGQNANTVDTVGVDGEFKNVAPNWDIGASLLYQLAQGQIAVIQIGTTGAFPNITERLQEIKLYAKRKLTSKLFLRLDYGLQRYRSNDWALDNVGPDTIPNILTLGIQSPNYTVNIFGVTIQYIF